MAGVSATGLVIKTVSDIIDDLNALWRSTFGQLVNVDPRSRNGQIIAALASPLSDVWELAEAVRASIDPDAATGVGLDNVSKLTGTVREPASFSTGTETLTGTPATVVPINRVISVPGTTFKYETQAQVTIAAATAWAPTTAYTVGQRVTNASRIYQCITAGTSAGSGGPTSTSTDITDGTAHWAYVGEGTGVVDVAIKAQGTGVWLGYARTITNIETLVAGWSTAVNLADVTLGADLELDASLRARREEELAGAGGPQVDGIRARVLDVTGVTAVTVFENTTDITVDGITPHAVEVLVEGGADVDIRAAIFAAAAGGIETCGNVSGTVTDSTGRARTIKFSRVTTVNVYVKISLTKVPGVAGADNASSVYPEDGDDAVKAALVTYGDEQKAGRDVEPSVLSAQVVPRAGNIGGVPGVIKVSSVTVSDVDFASCSSTPITLTVRQKAEYDTSRIQVTSVDGVP